jgi:threonine/homoserine/homoserine lactone efflux protein
MITDLYASFLLTTLLIELTPGPNMAWLALISASNGRRSGFAAVAGIALGLGLLAAAAAVGMTELITRSRWVFSMLRYAGAAYLLWLAWKAWTGENELSRDIATQNGLGTWFRHGLLLNLLNPKAAVFFITVLPAYVSADGPIAPQTGLLSASYVGVATAIHLVIVLFAGQANGWISVGNRSHIIRRIFAGLLAAIAAWFLIYTG